MRSQSAKPVSSNAPTKLPANLVGPLSVVPVLVEGIYTRAPLDSGAQFTLLTRAFYERYLLNIPLRKLEDIL